jgi:23S rRNA pseudouridine2605 synthase
MKKKTGFEKFHKVKSGSALKEQIRQEKKKITKERKEYFEAKRQEKYGQQSAGSNQQSGIRSSESGRKTTNYKLKTKNPGLQTAAAPQMPLNKYIAHSGVCSRRDAAELIKSGKVKLNGEVVTEPGRKVTEKDVVIVGNKKVYPVADLV